MVAGRWHNKGTEIAYAAATESLSLLEILVHLTVSQLPRDHICHRIEIPEDCVDFVPEELLPADWLEESPHLSRDFGSAWVKGYSSAALAIPSVVVPREYNYLLNPVHRDFKQISVVDSWPLRIDPRLSAGAGVSTGVYAELQDRLLRSRAEFENFRKRTERERAELAEVGGMDLAGKLLPLLDQLEHALAAESVGADSLRPLYSRLCEALDELGLKRIEAIGRTFDPRVHHAADRVENPEGAEDQEILAEYERGYSFHGRLLRPAVVKVAVRR